MKRSIFIFCILYLTACKRTVQPIDYGHDACTHCKMTIMDNRFAAEMITGKGKVYKFDDMACLLGYMAAEKKRDPEALYFVSDHKQPEGSLLDAQKAVFIRHEMLKSPMQGNYAAFASAQQAAALKDSLHSKLLKWEDLQPVLP